MATTGGVAGSGELGGAAVGTPVAAMIAGGFAFIVRLICGMGAGEEKGYWGDRRDDDDGRAIPSSEPTRNPITPPRTAPTMTPAVPPTAAAAAPVVAAVAASRSAPRSPCARSSVVPVGESRGFWRARAGR